MLTLKFFVSDWVLFDGAFSSWVFLTKSWISKVQSQSSMKQAYTVPPVVPSYLTEIIQDTGF